MNVIKAFVCRGTQALHMSSPLNHAMFLTITPKKHPLNPFQKGSVSIIQLLHTLTWLRIRSWAILILERSSGVYSTTSALVLPAQTQAT